MIMKNAAASGVSKPFRLPERGQRRRAASGKFLKTTAFKNIMTKVFIPFRAMSRRVVYFFNSEPASGIVLMLAAACGLWVANSAYAPQYFETLHHKYLGLSGLHWINDGLMAVFFLYVGLEVKREFMHGELSDWPARLLPGVAALFGMLVPALIFIVPNLGNPQHLRGWAIPAATDIAFALGVLMLLGSRVPGSLKVFLTALAIMDDLAAIVVIALFYSGDLHLLYLLAAAGVLLVLALINRMEVFKTRYYVVLGLLLWWLVLKSGIHATLAGVALALAVPLQVLDEVKAPMLERWEEKLSPWVAFFIVPVFGFANAGVSFAGFEWAMLGHPVVLGVALGLFLGKQAGVFGSVWLAVKFKLAKIPENSSWLQLYGVALLCGIGFTMSLFIDLLAFGDPHLQDLGKIGVFLGSALAGVGGFAVLRLAKPAPAAPEN